MLNRENRVISEGSGFEYIEFGALLECIHGDVHKYLEMYGLGSAKRLELKIWISVLKALR